MLMVISFSKSANLIPMLERTLMLRDSRQRLGDTVLRLCSCGENLAGDVAGATFLNILPFQCFRRLLCSETWRRKKISAVETISQESSLVFHPVAFEANRGVYFFPTCIEITLRGCSLSASIPMLETFSSELQCYN